MTKTEALQALHDATGGDLYDAVWENGAWMVGAVETADSLADFEVATASYAERSAMTTGTIAGLPFISFKRVQVRKSDARQALTVIDLGDVRVAINAEVDQYAE